MQAPSLFLSLAFSLGPVLFFIKRFIPNALELNLLPSTAVVASGGFGRLSPSSSLIKGPYWIKITIAIKKIFYYNFFNKLS